MILLLERPLPIVIAGGILTALLVAGLVQTGRRSLLWAIAVVVLLTGGLLLLERFVVTPREEVEASLRRIAAAVEQNDADAVVAFISSRSPELQQAARSSMAAAEITSVRIKNNLEITVDAARNPPQAVAEFNVVIEGRDRAGAFGHQTYPRFFRVIFRQEDDGQWRVTDYEDLDPVRH